jgi:hypothetical protein
MFITEMENSYMGDTYILVRTNGAGRVTVAKGGKDNWIVDDTITTDGGAWFKLGMSSTQIKAYDGAEFMVLR